MLIMVMKKLEGMKENDFSFNHVEFQLLVVNLTNTHSINDWRANIIEGKEFST